MQKIRKQNNKFDLEERTIQFGKDVIDFLKKLPITIMTKPIIGQLLRSATSIGANYCEADEANSKKDFIHKITIAKKETKETKYWLRILAHTMPEFKLGAKKLWQEAQELNLILAKCIITAKNN